MRTTFAPISILSFFLLTSCQNHTHNHFHSGEQATIPAVQSAALSPPPKKIEEPDQFKLEKNKDPQTLSELIDLALAYNPKTTVAWERVRESQAKRGQAESAYYPEIDLSAGIARAKSPSPLTRNSYYQTLYNASLNMSYTLLDFGQRNWGNKEATSLMKSAEHMQKQTFQNVIQQVKTDYFDFLYQLSLQEARLEDEKNAKLAFEIASAKYEGGTGDKSDIATAKTGYYSTRSKLTDQDYHVKIAYSRLTADIGFPFETELNLKGFEEQPDISRDLKSAETLVDLAMRNRPELKSLKSRLDAEKADVRYQRSRHYPTLKATANIGENYSRSSGAHCADSSFMTQLELSFPIFNGLYFRNKTKEAQAKMRTAKAALKEKEIEVIRTVLDAKNGVQSAADRYRSTHAFLDAALSSYEITLSKYRSGTTPLLNLSQAISDLADARAQHLEAKKDWYLFLTDLGYATGILSAQMLDEMPVDLIQLPKKEQTYE